MEGDRGRDLFVLQADAWWRLLNGSTILRLYIVNRLGPLEQNVDVSGPRFASSLDGSTDEFFKLIVGNNDIQLLGGTIGTLQPEDMLR